MYYCPTCKKQPPWVNIDRFAPEKDAEGNKLPWPRKACPTCKTTLELGSTGRAPAFHLNTYQKVEAKRSHLPGFQRDPCGNY